MIRTSQSLDPVQTKLADKFRARAVVSELIGDEYLVPLLWSGTRPENIPFDDLPERYVIKTNHGSGSIIIGGPSIDRKATIAKLREWLAENYYWCALEGQYFKIKPVVMVEKFIGNEEEPPLDYRFFCFGGEPGITQVDNFKHSINPFYDKGWNRTDLTYRKSYEEVDVPKPPKLDEMMDLARKLSKGFDFVRIDLYCVGDAIFFGEFTFSPVAGVLLFKPVSWDAKLGELWPDSERSVSPPERGSTSS